MKKFFFLFTMLTVFTLSSVAANYLVVGADIVCNGQDWNNDADVNVMTTNDGGATYQLTIEGLTLETGTNYEYKIVEKGSWTEYFPKTGVNATFQVSSNGIYTIQYVYTPTSADAGTCNVTTTKTGEAGEITHTYTVAGAPAELFGTEWDPSNTANDMTLANGVYTWSKSDVTLSNGTKIQFKCARDHAWGVAYPSSNYEYSITEDGTYDVVITLDASTFDVNCTVTKKGTHTYTVAGNNATIFGTTWDPSNTANDMTEVNGLYTFTKEGLELTADDLGLQFKVVVDHSWDVAYPAENYSLPLTQDGTYDLTITFDPETNEVNAQLERQAAEPAFALVGSFNEWNAEANPMTKDANADVWTATVSAANAAEFKFFDTANNEFYGGMTGDLKETYGVHAGWKDNIPTATDGLKNFKLTLLEDAELTFTLTKGEQGYSFSVAGFPTIENGMYLVGSFNEWKPITGAVPFVENVATATLEAGAQFKVIKANENELTWYGGDTQGESETFELKADFPTADLTADAANFIINTAGEYTFTIENGSLTVSGWPEPVVEITAVELLGSSNEWAEPLGTFAVEDASTGYWTLNEVAFAANDQFKIHVAYSDNTEKWLAPESDGKFLVSPDYLNTELALVENSPNMYVENAATLSFALAPAFDKLFITGEFEEPQPVEPYATVYVDKASVEGDIYYFDLNGQDYGEWPGVAINSLETAEKDGVEYYAVKFTHEGENPDPKVVFSQLVDENRVQTADIPVADGDVLKYLGGNSYELNGTIYPLPVEKDYYLTGTFNEWNNDNAIQLVKQEDGSYVAENVELSAGDEFLVYEKSANDTFGPEAALTLSYDVPGANLVPSVFEANFKVESDVTLKVKVAVNESNQLYIHTEGWPEPQPEVLSYRIVGDNSDEWSANPIVYELTLNSETGYYESPANLNIDKGFNFKFNISGDQGTNVWYGGVTGSDHWFDILAEQFGNAISISESGTNIYFMKDATGVKFAVKADFSELIISGAYVPTVTLAEALAGAQAGVISDELTVVRVKDEYVYVTNGTDYLRLAGVENAAELEPGHVIAAEQIAVPVANPATNPTATVNGPVNATAGENVPEVAELKLRDGITTMPKPAQIVKITGYYVVEDGTPKFSAYSGKHGGNGNTIILNDAAGMEVDAEYTIEAAIELAAAWDSENTVTDVNTNLEGDDTITIGGGSTQPGRVKASDKDALSNLKLTVVGTPTATGVADLTTDKPVAGIQYVNVAGQVSAEPFDGINIVVTTYVDGTRSAVKVVK